MKKIDLHIHTVPTISDSVFTFSMEQFKRYVDQAGLDAIAITNHDLFDGDQFRLIQQTLDVVVFPGIEINVEQGHVLIIGCASKLEDFELKSDAVAKRITKIGDHLSVDELKNIYGDLSNYLVIPHYDKAPPIRGQALDKLKPFICAGEVDSAKKFVRAIKDESKPTPVLFSDSRIRSDLTTLPTRQTYVDCGVITLNALKTSLRDKRKVSLTAEDGNKLWPVFDNGQKLSTGLNVLMGVRSSGKTHTLNEINNTAENVKYIKQFSLVQQSEAEYERDFNSEVERRRSVFVDEYLSGLKRVLDEVMNIDLSARDREIATFVDTLLKSAEETDKRDAFSKAALFDEDQYPVGNTKTLVALIESVRQVIENGEYRAIIEKHIALKALKNLASELIELLWQKTLEYEKKRFVNGLVKEIKQGLQVRTAAIQVADVDLYDLSMDRKRIQRFTEIVNILKKEAVIFEETLQGFKIEARKGRYAGAMEIKNASGVKTKFRDAFGVYDNPYEYLRILLSDESLSRAELYKLFVKITYTVLNEDGFEVSGGERSEFRLLQEISDAQNYDILLIDEPESSFDNIFLKSDVNQILKDISQTMPVVVVTHNNTVGASIGADYLLYAKKELEEGSVIYRIYSGHPADKQLYSIDGKVISTHEIMLNSLEAGEATYESRRQSYEAVKN